MRATSGHARSAAETRFARRAAAARQRAAAAVARRPHLIEKCESVAELAAARARPEGNVELRSEQRDALFACAAMERPRGGRVAEDDARLHRRAVHVPSSEAARLRLRHQLLARAAQRRGIARRQARRHHYLEGASVEGGTLAAAAAVSLGRRRRRGGVESLEE